MNNTVQLRRIKVIGPKVEPAELSFGPGLNVVQGSSNTGKSHLLALIDFAFGARSKPTAPPEGMSYDSLLATVEISSHGMFTICRSLKGGKIKIVEGQADTFPSEKEGLLVGDRHGDGKSLSEWFLDKLNLEQPRIRKNARGELRDLSFRDLVHLALISETKIQSELSPIEGGQYGLRTAELCAFKFVLTGDDDSSLEGLAAGKNQVTRRAVQIELIDEEISELKGQTEELEKQQLELEHQNLQSVFSEEFTKLRGIGTPYRSLLKERREIGQTLSELANRQDEIQLLTDRFLQLDQHYESDIARLRAIQEAGDFFSILKPDVCPLCGAAPEHHSSGSDACDAEEIQTLRDGAQAEVSKIQLRKVELGDLLQRLQIEGEEIPARIAELEEDLQDVESEISAEAPDVRAAEDSVRTILNAQSSISTKLTLIDRLSALESKRTDLLGTKGGDAQSLIAEEGLPGAIRTEFETEIEKTLKEWQFSESGKVVFDLKTRDIEIDGKPRRANGKGVRAILHAAFSISLMKYCSRMGRPYPGFLLLDTPLLTYRDPMPGEVKDAQDEKLAASDLKSRFFENVGMLASEMQLIVLENVDLPAGTKARPTTQVFSGRGGSGRRGFYPTSK